MSATSNEAKAGGVVDARGNLFVPSNYRTTYGYPGTWTVAADESLGSQQLHVVYASPGTIDAYRSSGHFPDGTVLVKEVFAAAAGPTVDAVGHD
jgi:hypothetical protein